MTHISYPSIGQFRNCIKLLTDNVRYLGKDESCEPIYDSVAQLPVIEMTGTVKLHGTNAAVCGNIDDYWAQSRERTLSIKDDNMGFCAFALKNQKAFDDIISQIVTKYSLDCGQTVCIFGEWVGKGIQSGVAISQIDKSFFIFVIMTQDGDGKQVWYPIEGFSSPENRIFNISDYPIFKVTVDFNNPQLIQNQLIEITNAVEQECPVAKAFGHSGIGEGVVWSFTYNNRYYNFKVKGEKHSVSKVKSLASVDTEKLNSINEFVDYVVTESRVNQFITQVFGSKEKFEHEKIGDFLRAFNNDVIKEETDTLIESGLDWKSVSGAVSRQAKIVLFRIVL